jgi:hypothetical protein
MAYFNPTTTMQLECARYEQFYVSGEPVGKVVVGDRSGAASIQDGYVYVFEDYPTGTDPLVFNMSSRRTLTIAIINSGKPGNYFFMYSKKEIPAARLEAVRKDLNDFITAKGTNDANKYYFYQPQYIPLINISGWKRPWQKGDVTLNSSPVVKRYLCPHVGEFHDMEFIATGAVYTGKIYLYDWLGLLKKFGDEYQKRLKTYHDFFEETVDCKGDFFKIKDIFPLTEIIDKIYEENPGKYIGNLRTKTKTRVANQYNPSSASPYQSPEFKEFLQSIGSKINALRDNLGKYIKPILGLLGDTRANSAFINSLYSSNSDKAEMLNYLGVALQELKLVIDTAGNRRFNLIMQAMYETQNEITEHISGNPTVESIHNGSGDRFLLQYISLLDLLNYFTDTSTNILDTMLEHIRDLPLTVTVSQFKALQKGLFKDFAIPKRFCATTKRSLLKYAKDKKIAIPYTGKEVNFNQLANYFKDRVTTDLRNRGYRDEASRIRVVQTSDNAWELVINEQSVEPIEANIKKLARAGKADDLVTKWSILLAGFNIVYQTGLLADCGLKPYAIPGMINIASSGFSIAGTLKKMQGNMERANRYAGVALALSAAEACVNGYFLATEKDYDASAFSWGAGGAYGGAAAAVFLGVTTAGVVPLLTGLGVFFTFLSAWFTDEPPDYFLKYSIWGKEYQKPWEGITNEHVPSWWPSSGMEIEQIEADASPLCVGGEKTKTDAYWLYSKDNSSKEKIIRSNYAILNIIHRLPQSKITFGRHTVLENGFQVGQYALLRFDANDFEYVKTVTVNIMEQTGFNKDNPRYGKKYAMVTRLDKTPLDPYFFSAKTAGPVTARKDLYSADRMEILLIPGRDAIRALCNNAWVFSKNTVEIAWLKESMRIHCELTVEYSTSNLRSARVIKDYTIGVNQGGSHGRRQ